MPWTQQQFHQHLVAARLLDHIREETWRYLRANPRCREFQAQRFILGQFRQHRLRNQVHRPIVAFRQSTSVVHYYPPAHGSRRLRPGSWILLDLWARQNLAGAPYADLTWMAWYGGRVPPGPARIFRLVAAARDASLAFVRAQTNAGRLPTGSEVDAVARRLIARAGFGRQFPHGLGHSLGNDGPHGSAGPLSPKNRRPIRPGMGYTIEPGIYLAGRYGARCEMDFFLTPEREVVVTAERQRELVRISPLSSAEA